ncbi:uncharacterized protein V6R79_004501 [Siganus canaliculatus]
MGRGEDQSGTRQGRRTRVEPGRGGGPEWNQAGEEDQSGTRQGRRTRVEPGREGGPEGVEEGKAEGARESRASPKEQDAAVVKRTPEGARVAAQWSSLKQIQSAPASQPASQ